MSPTGRGLKLNHEMTAEVLEEGAIVEDGTHAELSQAGGVYESLWDRQTGTFLEGE